MTLKANVTYNYYLHKEKVQSIFSTTIKYYTYTDLFEQVRANIKELWKVTNINIRLK